MDIKTSLNRLQKSPYRLSGRRNAQLLPSSKAQDRKPAMEIDIKHLALDRPLIGGLDAFDYSIARLTLYRGSLLRLVRETNNPKDPYSIGIWYGACKLGYLPADTNKGIANIIDRGLELEAILLATHPETKTAGESLYIEIRFARKKIRLIHAS